MREFNLRMIDGKELHCYEWTDVVKPIAVLQLVHGASEHALRYADFAKRMNEKGIIVVGDDHRGHGKTADLTKNELGFFAIKNGWHKIVDDEKMLNDYIHKTWNELPVFMLGHSMGSFIARTYAIKYSETISGSIIMGTAENSRLKLFFAKRLACFQQFFLGPKKTAILIWKLSFKPLNKQYDKTPNKTGHEWLTSDVKIQKTFEADPLAKQIFSTSAFKDLFTGLIYNSKLKNIKRMRKNLPILIVSGEDDRVGDNGKMPTKVQNKFASLNYNSNLILYPGVRHEVLNEKNHDVAEKDIINFIKTNLQNL